MGHAQVKMPPTLSYQTHKMHKALHHGRQQTCEGTSHLGVQHSSQFQENWPALWKTISQQGPSSHTHMYPHGPSILASSLSLSAAVSARNKNVPGKVSIKHPGESRAQKKSSPKHSNVNNLGQHVAFQSLDQDKQALIFHISLWT